jgi:beta-aspartyl-peptidase (threonine type)
LESNEHFNAGRGSLLSNEREVECDAMIMEGETLNYGKVTQRIYVVNYTPQQLRPIRLNA